MLHMIQCQGGSFCCIPRDKSLNGDGFIVWLTETPSGPSKKDTRAFKSVEDLEPELQLVVSCSFEPCPDRVRALVAGGLDPDSVRAPGLNLTVLEFASRRGLLEIVKCLVEDCGASVNVGAPLHWACYTDSISVSRFLYAAGARADIPLPRPFCPTRRDCPVNNGSQAIHLAAGNRALKCLKWLVEKVGVSPNVRDADGLTPLDYAQEDAGMDDGTQFANVSGAGQEIAACAKYLRTIPGIIATKAAPPLPTPVPASTPVLPYVKLPWAKQDVAWPEPPSAPPRRAPPCSTCGMLPPHGAKWSACGGCHQRFYCSPGCQRVDWRAKHKKECKKDAGTA